MRYLSINQSQVFTHIPASTFRWLRHIFLLLRVFRNSSSQTRCVLEFRVSTSWPWHPSASLLSGPKCSSYHLRRLQGQIGRHALTFEADISPLCLQISLCTNTSFGTPGGTDSRSRSICRTPISTWRMWSQKQRPISGMRRNKLWQKPWRNTSSNAWSPLVSTGAARWSKRKHCRHLGR